MNRFNKADRLLCLLFLLFMIALFLKITYPGSIFTKGLFFCSEAALVGGIADWFAVTALFKKPLGFSYHTELIPRKREMLIQGCVEMVQNEFFSKKKLILRLKKVSLIDTLFIWIEENQGKEIFSGLLIEFIERSLMKIDSEKIAAKLEQEVKVNLKKVPLEVLSMQVCQWLIHQHKEEEFFKYLLAELKNLLEGQAAQQKIVDYIEEYVEEQKKNILFALFAFAAQKTDIINYEEAAEVVREQLLNFVEELSEEDNPMRQWFLGKMQESMEELLKDETWQSMIKAWQDGIIENLSLQAEIKNFIDRIILSCKRQPIAQNSGSSLVTQAPITNFIVNEIDRGLEVLKTDVDTNQEVEAYLFDLVGRIILQAQALIGVIVNEVMEELSDEELNEIIYAKVDQDLTWIRMNGSIVGALLGFIIFSFIQVL
ncbi:MAG: hypothetical protein H6Q70_1258 [Firmicutes bacterium]|nr:hypothetical protein [Bacillota bacterium]